MNRKLCLVGGGNMGRAIVGGLIGNGYAVSDIEIIEPDADRRAALAADFGVTVHESNATMPGTAGIVLLAVKPQVMADVVGEIKQRLDTDDMPLLISIAAGITTAQICRWFDASCRIVRVMPNTPALVGAGAAGLYATDNVTRNERELANEIMAAVGMSVWLDEESQIDAVTALSGSGPAYFFLVIEALENAGRELGLSAELARKLAIQTAFGAALLAQRSSDDPAELRRQVTSPGGTTERAVNALIDDGIFGMFQNALTAARDRAVELAKESEQTAG